ncbi:hypothetical protein [Aliterella atlantica]|uniref:CopG family transcriptional regulator n=1 Tax=Aliterella atlantica CENA595 TaxID=1618023 RepID=A0A0D8ZPK2_9CYAN|nr:hypothetical protein [Aliterella atlantica]KJH70262.1 hypothetical protein UH38_19135 [Aliterella atlantica CENA595]
MSKFKSLLDAAKGKEPEPEKHELEVNQPQLVAEPEQPPKRGRPKGKRSHPDYEQVTAYIRKDTHRAAKIALLSESEGREFSELVQELLEQWLKART